jgi:hypothetical protein
MDKEDFKKHGIYAITSIDKKYLYIGSTCDKRGFRQRLYLHNLQLRKNTHHNNILQNIYNKHGADYLQFNIIKIMSLDIKSIHSEEERLIRLYLEDNNQKLINISLNAHGGDWTLNVDKDRIKEVYSKMVQNYSKERRIERNFKHKQTLLNTPNDIKKERIDNHCKTYHANRNRHKNYKPIIISINDDIIIKSNTQQEFFNITKFETSILEKLKKTGMHIIKRLLPCTKHSYPVGTVVKLISDIN